MLQYYNILKDKHVGSSCFICGAGLSFFDIVESKYFNNIFDHVVISVNSSIIAMSWFDGSPDNRYWISNDSAVRLWTYWEQVKKSNATRIIRDSWKKYYSEIPKDFLVFSPRSSNNNIDFEEEKLSFVSSVPTSIDLAIQMGCKKIFLLGCDHYTVNNKSHFWQRYAKEKQPTTKGHIAPVLMQQFIFSQNIESYVALKKFAEHKECNIFDCSKRGRIKVFDKIDFEGVFNENLEVAG